MDFWRWFRLSICLWLVFSNPAMASSLSAADVARFNNRVFTGTFAEVLSSCTSPSDPSDEGTFAGTAQVSLLNVQTSGSLILSVTGTDSDGASFAGGVTSMIDPNGSGTFPVLNISTPSTGRVTTISGIFQVGPDGSFQLSMPGLGSDNQGCNVQVSFDGTGSAPGAVNPDTAPAILFAESGGHAQFSRQTVSIITDHARGVVYGARGGQQRLSFVPGAHGFNASAAGLAAGEGGLGVPLGVWGNITYSQSDNDFAPTAFDTNRLSVLAGIDALAAEGLLVGVALGYESSDTSTVVSRGSADTTGFTVAPYVAYQFTDQFSFDASAGYTDLSTDQTREAAGSIISSETEGARWFVAGNVNYGRTIGNWFVGARLGVLVAQSRQDAFTESNGNAVGDFDFEVRQLRLGMEASYALGNWEPFVHGTFEHDYDQTTVRITGAVQPESERSGMVFGAGTRWYFGEHMSASLEYSGVFGRGNFDQDAVNFLFRAEF